MFKIIGADGREYGPVTAADLRTWIAQGRANAATKVLVEGATNWIALSELPEFGPDLARAYGTRAIPNAVAPQPTSAASLDAIAAEYLQRKNNFSVSLCLSRGWELVRDNFWLSVGASVLVTVLIWAASFVPIAGPLLLNYVLLGGLDWLFLRLLRRQPTEVSDAFVGFGKMFVPLMLFSLVGQLLTGLGLILCILPGIYAMIVWLIFPALLILDKGMDFWPAMELSRKVAQKHFWGLLGLLLIGFLLFVAGTLALVVGFFIAMPIVTASFVVAYEELFGAQPQAPAVIAGPEPQPVTPEAPVVPTNQS